MYLYEYICVVAVLELDSHPDHNKGPDQALCVCPKTHPIDLWSINTTERTTNPLIARPLSVYGNELSQFLDILRHFPSYDYCSRVTDIAAVGLFFNIFVMTWQCYKIIGLLIYLLFDNHCKMNYIPTLLY